MHRLAILGLAAIAAGQTTDPAAEMIAGMSKWLLRESARTQGKRDATRERLRYITGVVDERVPFEAPELIATTATPAKLAENAAFTVYAVRWPVLDGITAEGLLFEPKRVVARVIALPDAGTPPERFVLAQRLAEAGCQVLTPVLIDTEHTWSGNPRFRMTKQPHREYIYRMAFPVGRHIIGYEVQKALAAVDWFARQGSEPIAAVGHGEGGMIALFAAALDERISVALISGYRPNFRELWREPLYRNLWGILSDFGEDGVQSLARKLTWSEDDLFRELRLQMASSNTMELPAPHSRMRRQFQELVEYTQTIVRLSEPARDELWARDPEKVRERLWDDVIGRMPAPDAPPNPRLTRAYEGEKWVGYDVRLDTHADVFVYGVLLTPKQLRGRHPVVVAQHGLNGRPQSMFGQPQIEKKDGRNSDWFYYRNLASHLADEGFVVFVPQNFYTGDFRFIQRQANPLRLSTFSFTLAWHQRILEWLSALDYVDPGRIGFYGLSYGGKTALRIPPLLPGYALSICSGDFNEWIHKLTTVDAPYSYMFTIEWEIPEWNLGHVANHAEMAKLMAPRPFMVERGHRDGVGVDEWVAYEFADVARYYDELGLGRRARIEYFNGPHRIHARGTIEFLKEYLRWP
jgi:dienelactone hydrolase